MAGFYGSNAKITLSDDDIRLENSRGVCRISVPSGYRYKNEEVIRYNGVEVIPTLNGIALIAEAGEGKRYTMRISTDAPLSHVSNNQKCFCTMLTAIEPHLVVSCVGALDGKRELISPAYIQYRTVEKNEFEISVCADSPKTKYLLFEINLHASKLFLDTTVESKDPESNNAFGGTAFIGETGEFGEQILYCRPLLASLGGLKDANIKSAVFYIPKLDTGKALLSAHRLTVRFCSFASNWSNRKPAAYKYVISEIKNGYHTLDLSDMLLKNGAISSSAEGFMLKTPPDQKGFCAISAADSFLFPQMLEITFKKNGLD